MLQHREFIPGVRIEIILLEVLVI